MKQRSIVLLALMLAQSTGDATAGNRRGFTLDDVQGIWWERCDAPSGEFLIDGDRFRGNFAAEYKVRVERHRLVIEQGTEPALEYRIVTATPQRLVLRPLFDATGGDWVMRRCADTSGHQP